METKTTINISEDILIKLFISLVLGFLLTVLINHFSKSWFFLMDENSYEYITFSSDGYMQSEEYDWRMYSKIPISAYELESLFGSKIEKAKEIEFLNGALDKDGWIKGTWDRAKFKNYLMNLIFYTRLSVLDWKIVLLFSGIIFGLWVFFQKFKFKLNASKENKEYFPPEFYDKVQVNKLSFEGFIKAKEIQRKALAANDFQIMLGLSQRFEDLFQIRRTTTPKDFVQKVISVLDKQFSAKENTH